jgi:hypothetical protein
MHAGIGFIEGYQSEICAGPLSPSLVVKIQPADGDILKGYGADDDVQARIAERVRIG